MSVTNYETVTSDAIVSGENMVSVEGGTMSSVQNKARSQLLLCQDKGVPDKVTASLPRSITSTIKKTSLERAQSRIVQQRKVQELRKPLFRSTMMRPSQDLSKERLTRRRQDRRRLTMLKRAVIAQAQRWDTSCSDFGYISRTLNATQQHVMCN